MSPEASEGYLAIKRTRPPAEQHHSNPSLSLYLLPSNPPPPLQSSSLQSLTPTLHGTTVIILCCLTVRYGVLNEPCKELHWLQASMKE
jgi:hypothetical protein